MPKIVKLLSFPDIFGILALTVVSSMHAFGDHSGETIIIRKDEGLSKGGHFLYKKPKVGNYTKRNN
jgi:hypothetical protein